MRGRRRELFGGWFAEQERRSHKGKSGFRRDSLDQNLGLGFEDAFEVALGEDGSILLTGYRDGGLAEGTFLNWGRGVAVKTDASGKEIWLRDLSEFTSSGYRIRAQGQGSLVACHPRDEESEEYNLLRLDQSGKVEWAKTYGEIYWDSIKTPRARFCLRDILGILP